MMTPTSQMTSNNKPAQMPALALTEAEVVIAQELKRLHRYTRVASDVRAEMRAEALLWSVRAWATWSPELGLWQPHCRMHVRTMCSRVGNRARSVVTTGYATRTLQADAGMTVQTAEGEVERDFDSEQDATDTVVEVESAMARTFAHWTELMQDMTACQRNIAERLVAARFEANVSDLAEELGVTRPTVYKVKNLLREAALFESAQ